jgi:hypothetical protein
MSQSQATTGFSPGNLLWALLALGAVLVIGFASTVPVHPETDVDAKRGALRSETRKKIQAEESSKLDSVKFVERKAEFVTLLGSSKPAPSGIKVDPPLPLPVGDAPSLPSAPSGALNVTFPKLVTPMPPAPAPEPPASAPVPAPPVPSSAPTPAPTPGQ